MMEQLTTCREPRAALVDFGMGNLSSVERACAAAGLATTMATTADEILAADAVILPGVGAFGDAMQALRALDMVSPLRQLAAEGVPMFGVCLGLQLLLSSSCEFGEHEGLDIIPGRVESLAQVAASAGQRIRVPHVGWNRISPPIQNDGQVPSAWKHSPLARTAAGEFMYFVHSYYAVPDDERVVLSTTTYAGQSFCSSLMAGNVWACQFHPELSGPAGIEVYRRFRAHVARHVLETAHAS